MNLEEKNIDKIHKTDLGYKIPEDYFSKSKNEILSKVLNKKETKIRFLSKSNMIWLAVAGIALLFTFTVFKQQINPSIKNIPTIVSDTLNTNELLNLATDYIFEEDVLIASLFVEDTQVQTFIDNAFIEGIVADEYLDDYIVDQLITEDLFD